MKVSKYEDRDAWLAGRLGKITGSRLKGIVTLRGTGKKLGYYELIAERLAVPEDAEYKNETPMERGARLEPEAMARFIQETGKEVDTSLVIWQREDDNNIAVSPDGFIGNTEAVECKCLSSARHIEAYLTKKVPSEYDMQAVQYFIVNDELHTLYVAFYDPRLTVKDFFTITITREEVQEDIENYLAYQRSVLAEITDIVNSLTF